MDIQSPMEHEPTGASRHSRRAILGLALGAALGAVGLTAAAKQTAKQTPERANTLAAAAQRRRRPQPRTKVVTRTFSTRSPMLINDEDPAFPYPSRVTVSGLTRGTLLDVNLRLSGFHHEYPRDLDLLLVAPNGRRAVVMSDVGGSDEVGPLTVVLDDQASAPPTVLGPLGSGIFRPWNEAVPGEEADPFPAPAAFSPNVALSTFTGINPNGTWQLYVVDDSSSDTGSITGGWVLTIKARVRV